MQGQVTLFWLQTNLRKNIIQNQFCRINSIKICLTTDSVTESLRPAFSDLLEISLSTPN
jgi:hypothetical protein